MIQKCECKYKKVELADKEDVHNAKTLPIRCRRLSRQKTQTTVCQGKNCESRLSKDLKDENSKDCTPDDECSLGQTRVEIYAAPSEKLSDSVETTLVEEKICQCTLPQQRGTDTIREFLKNCESKLDQPNSAEEDCDKSEIAGDENDGHQTYASTLEAECNRFEVEGIVQCSWPKKCYENAKILRKANVYSFLCFGSSN